MSSKGKILITDDIHPLLCQGLESDGYTVNYQPGITPEQVLADIGSYTGLIVNSKVYVSREMINRAVKLKFVCRAGSGLEVIDTVYAAEKGINTFNSPEGNCNAVGEHALAMLLNLMNHISKADAEVRNYEWKREENRGHQLTGRTIGLLAFGHTAQAFSKLLSGFDVTILAYDKYYTGFSAGNIHEATLEEIFERAEILSLHLPLTAETHYMADYPFLSSFKKPYWLINTSRGKVLKTSALLQCLEEGRIRGAALDVLENEKLDTFSAEEKKDFNELIADRRVLLTPHIAGWTYESKRRIAEVLLEKIKLLEP